MSPITPGSSLDAIKREAKRWLKALRDNVAEARTRFERALREAPENPTLRDVQHALARELGFSGWTALKNHHAAREGESPSLARYERMATNLLDAYRTGTPEAMERHWNDTWHRRAWQAMRTYVQLDLGKRPAPGQTDVDITRDDARKLVARDQGFASWDALIAHLKTLPTDDRLMADHPVRAIKARAGEEPDDVVTSRELDLVFDAFRDGRATGLRAEGQMTDALLERISHFTTVTTLALSGSKSLTDEGLRHLARMPQLRELDLGGCAITDRGLEVLRHLPSLERLELWWTRVTDEGAAHLASCERLERVNLMGTATGDGTIRALAGKVHLRHFATGQRVTDEGIPALHDIPAFKEWLNGEIELALLSPEGKPNTLTLRGTFTDRGVASMVGLDGLFGLNMDDSALAVTPAGLEPLAKLPRLGLLGFDATDAAMPYIAALPALRMLLCQDTVAGDDGFEALGRSQSLEFIWGRRCYNLRRRGFLGLAQIPTLRGLSVSCKNVDDAGLAALPSFPALRELMPMDVPDDGYRYIRQCEQLERLVLMYCRDTGDKATEHIVGLPKLTYYFNSYTHITDRTPELLSQMTSLERIELGGCPGVTNAGVAALARMPNLRELHLGGMQNVTREVLAAFPERIRVRYSL